MYRGLRSGSAMSIDDQVYKQVNPDKLEQILERYYEEEGQE